MGFRREGDCVVWHSMIKLRVPYLLVFLIPGCIPPPNDPCVSPCELAAGFCEERDISEYPNNAATLADLRTMAGEGSDGFQIVTAVAGTCGEGSILFTYFNNRFTSETRYFDAAGGVFQSLATTTDALEPPCNGLGYWPVSPPCREGTITEVISAPSFRPLELGETISLP